MVCDVMAEKEWSAELGISVGDRERAIRDGLASNGLLFPDRFLLIVPRRGSLLALP